MSRFRAAQSGEVVDAVRFVGGQISDPTGLEFDGNDDAPVPWLLDAMNSKTLEISALGSGLVLNFRGGSYGLARGDWVVCLPSGELKPCRGDRFAKQFERIDG